jgi:hypothetical protein
MNMHRHLWRAVVVGAASLFALVSLVAPARASGSGLGTVDGTYAYWGSYPNSGIAFPVLNLRGRIMAAGQSYGGGFSISGMSARDIYDLPGSCVGGCLNPTQTTSYVGLNSGTVHGLDANYNAVTGQCSIEYYFEEYTGPLYVVPLDQGMVVNCTIRVRGSSPVLVRIEITGEEVAGVLVGAFTLS